MRRGLGALACGVGFAAAKVVELLLGDGAVAVDVDLAKQRGAGRFEFGERNLAVAVGVGGEELPDLGGERIGGLAGGEQRIAEFSKVLGRDDIASASATLMRPSPSLSAAAINSRTSVSIASSVVGWAAFMRC